LFIEEDRVQPARLSAAGYAQYHPIASNLTEEGRSRNRRVDIIVLPTRPLPGIMDRQLAHSAAEFPMTSPGPDQKTVQDFLLRASHTSLPSSTMPSSPEIR
jgi:Asp-tRNA(Asn)/Glu-tRNA(Gln) amidotransferase A subunit family amidase